MRSKEKVADASDQVIPLRQADPSKRESRMKRKRGVLYAGSVDPVKKNSHFGEFMHISDIVTRM